MDLATYVWPAGTFDPNARLWCLRRAPTGARRRVFTSHSRLVISVKAVLEERSGDFFEDGFCGGGGVGGLGDGAAYYEGRWLRRRWLRRELLLASGRRFRLRRDGCRG